MNRPAYVYRAFDKAGRLLYVGCSVDVDGRLAQHKEHSPWWIYADRIEREQFASREEAAAAETEAIASEHPRWNMRDRSREHPDGYANGAIRAPWLDGERAVWRTLNEQRRERGILISQLRQLDLDLAATCALVDQISGGSLTYGKDYTVNGPLTTREKKERALAELEARRSA